MLLWREFCTDFCPVMMAPLQIKPTFMDITTSTSLILQWSPVSFEFRFGGTPLTPVRGKVPVTKAHIALRLYRKKTYLQSDIVDNSNRNHRGTKQFRKSRNVVFGFENPILDTNWRLNVSVSKTVDRIARVAFQHTTLTAKRLNGMQTASATRVHWAILSFALKRIFKLYF